MIKVLFITFSAIFLLATANLRLSAISYADPEEKCRPTESDALGPFYKPDALVRSSVGKGYILSGIVKSSTDCSPIAKARIEFWLVGPDSKYDDDHRATVFSGKDGTYRFESNFPKSYFGRPPHIHILISAGGFRRLVTQHYPLKGTNQGTFDLVLVPER